MTYQSNNISNIVQSLLFQFFFRIMKFSQPLNIAFKKKINLIVLSKEDQLFSTDLIKIFQLANHSIRL